MWLFPGGPYHERDRPLPFRRAPFHHPPESEHRIPRPPYRHRHRRGDGDDRRPDCRNRGLLLFHRERPPTPTAPAGSAAGDRALRLDPDDAALSVCAATKLASRRVVATSYREPQRGARGQALVAGDRERPASAPA